MVEGGGVHRRQVAVVKVFCSTVQVKGRSWRWDVLSVARDVLLCPSR